jgi:hypothetical protein
MVFPLEKIKKLDETMKVCFLGAGVTYYGAYSDIVFVTCQLFCSKACDKWRSLKSRRRNKGVVTERVCLK